MGSAYVHRTKLNAFGMESEDDTDKTYQSNAISSGTKKCLQINSASMSYFYGEDGKCEAACGMVRFKFESILAAETFAPAEINFRTVKGSTGDNIRRQGVELQQTNIRKFRECI